MSSQVLLLAFDLETSSTRQLSPSLHLETRHWPSINTTVDGTRIQNRPDSKRIMASNVPPSLRNLPAGWTHWIHEPASGLITRYSAMRPAGAPAYTDLEVQIFLTYRQSRVLLFQVQGTNQWTAPSIVISANDDRTLCQVALDILQNAVEERALSDLQFLDNIVALRDLEPDPATPTKPFVKLLLSTAEPRLDPSTRINVPTPFSGFQWFDVTNSEVSIPLRNIPQERLRQVRDLMQRCQVQVQRAHQDGGIGLQIFYVNTIKAAIKTKQVDLGDKITHAFVALNTTRNNVLYLMNADAAVFREATQNNRWQIRNPVAIPDGQYDTRKYDIVGTVNGDRVRFSDLYVTSGMMLPNCRIAIEWIQETTLTRLKNGQAPVLPD